MYEYLTTHNLSNLQFGFRPLHFTLTALLDATDQCYTNMDNGLINGILFIDTIDNSHYRLFLKLGKEIQINHHS
jgi:hypothetical protein